MSTNTMEEKDITKLNEIPKKNLKADNRRQQISTELKQIMTIVKEIAHMAEKENHELSA